MKSYKSGSAYGYPRVKRDNETTIPDDQLPHYAGHPIRFIIRYAKNRAPPHCIVFGFVILAVGCAVFSSSAIRHLVDTMDAYPQASDKSASLKPVWIAVTWLAIIIAADNLSWRVAGWYAAKTFVAVTGDVRLDLFRYLTGHSTGYFADRMPAGLAARISTAGTATFTLESLMAWNVLPPCLNVLCQLL